MITNKNKKKAFSLIELLVALSILAVVTALLVPRFLNVREQAGERAARAQVAEINSIYLKWSALGGERNGSGPFETLSFLSSVPSSSTATRDCDIGNCTDTKGTFGSTSVVLTGIEMMDITGASFNFNSLPDICVYGQSPGPVANIKVGRNAWRLQMDDTRSDPFYLKRRFIDVDENGGFQVYDYE